MDDTINYDKFATVYYKSIINTLKLFSMKVHELNLLAGPTFNPLTELETELDYAFTPVIFETVFRNNLIHPNLKDDLLQFKRTVDKVPNRLWDYDYIDEHPLWINIKTDANYLLEKLNVMDRGYDDDYAIH